jgi:putative transposase
MRFRAIQEQDRRYPIRLMCRALAVSAAGYYAWRSHGLRAPGRRTPAPCSRLFE